MAFEPLQLARIRFHLGYSDNSASQFIQVQEDLRLDVGISELLRFQTVGTMPDTPAPDDGVSYFFLGQYLCQVGSLLHKVELAYEKINTLTIDDSLFISNVGSVSLRSNELSKRRSLYDEQRQQLSQMLEVTLYDSSRQHIGYANFY